MRCGNRWLLGARVRKLVFSLSGCSSAAVRAGLGWAAPLVQKWILDASVGQLEKRRRTLRVLLVKVLRV